MASWTTHVFLHVYLKMSENVIMFSGMQFEFPSRRFDS